MKRILLISFLAIITLILSANQVTLSINPNNVIYNYFYPSYLDPDNPEGQPVIFWLTTVPDEDVTDYEIRISFQWRDMPLITDAVVKPQPGSYYEVLEEGITYTMSSRDIILAGDSGDFYAEEGFEFDELIEANDEFKELVLDLGYFPDGDYIFTVQLYSEERIELSNPATFTFTIIAPTSITLISPGNPAGPAVTSIPDVQPYFVWFSNMINYDFRIYELDGGIIDPEEIELQYEPYFEDQVYNSLVYSYPIQAPPLEDGRIYGWQVLADVVTPMQTTEEKVKSNFYFFQISHEQGVDPQVQMLINFLEQLDLEGIEEIMQLLENGYDPTSINWQGETVEVEALNELLMQISNGEKEIKNIIIE